MRAAHSPMVIRQTGFKISSLTHRTYYKSLIIGLKLFRRFWRWFEFWNKWWRRRSQWLWRHPFRWVLVFRRWFGIDRCKFTKTKGKKDQFFYRSVAQETLKFSAHHFLTVDYRWAKWLDANSSNNQMNWRSTFTKDRAEHSGRFSKWSLFYAWAINH